MFGHFIQELLTARSHEEVSFSAHFEIMDQGLVQIQRQRINLTGILSLQFR